MNIKRIIYVLLLILVSGCAHEVVTTSDFVFVTPDKTDTFESLADEHLGTSALDWKIQESNDIAKITPGEELIIPLKPVHPGGLRADGYQQIPVLSYHNFNRGRKKDLLTVTSADFEEQLNYLKNEQFHTLTIEQMEAFLELGEVPRNSVLITIDDAWISSYKVAYPMLKEFDFNATLFIPTNYISSRTHKDQKTLSWAQVKTMVNDTSIDIQCHTKGHQDLNLTKSGESLQSYINSIENQLTKSKKIINEKIGKQVSSLAYPYGNTNLVVIEILKKNGYKTAFTVKRKNNPFFMHNFLLNRSMIYGVYNINQFIKNINVFNKFNIDKPELIDSIKDIRKISYLNPDQYEEKEQWRTALFAWKMQRDWLLSSQSGITAPFGSKENRLKRAEKRIAELDEKLKKIAQTHYITATKTKNNKEISKQLLRALLYDPNHQGALNMLKNMPFNKQLSTYTVKEKETFKSIARKVYKNKSNDVLIPLFNSNIKDESYLKPGVELILPTATAINNIKPTETIRCEIKLTKPASQVAEDLFTEANVLFNQDKITAAIDKLNKAICLNPNYDQAKEMLDMLSGL
jgi:peptidoglycan/xylan/chitin deacetylase (PgdA/CDA1 family)